jgi:Carboxypeptidase regulatory-like domain
MKRTLLLIVVSLLSVNSFAQTRRAARSVAPQTGAIRSNTQTLPIRRVILYSNGVAYIERRGTVTGHAEVSLSFKQSQVDDVLKSMIVLDLGQGRIGAVSYNSSAPPSTRLAEIPFSISSSAEGSLTSGLSGVLSQLQGARVIVSTANRTATGSILTVEERKSQIAADKPPAVTRSLVIASDKGELMGFDLNEVRSVQLVDEGTRRDITQFANASASARRRDAKTIVVTSDGGGSREMVVSYTIAAPIWKTTYRAVLDQSGKPFFQGWALVDNVSDEDWTNIQLSLVSGTPVSFIQPIQNPFYRYRPVVPMPEDLNLKPQVYEPREGNPELGSLTGTIKDANDAVVPGVGVEIKNAVTNESYSVRTNDEGLYEVSGLPPGTYTLTANSPGFSKMRVTDLGVKAGTESKFDVTLQIASISETVTVTGSAETFSNLPTNGRGLYTIGGNRTRSNNMMLDGLSALRPTKSVAQVITQGESGVQTEATGGEVGDLFEYRIDQPVTVPRDRSALIPILQTRMEGERVSIFDESAHGGRPLGGMLLKNNSPLTLEGGSITVIDGDAYAGEALMERLKPGEERLISFSLDLGTLVSSRTKADRAPAFLVKALNGVFQAHYYETNAKTYTLTNQTDKPRVVFVQHPMRQGWKLADDVPKPESRTANSYRFRVTLKPHETIALPISERRELMETYDLTSFSRPQLELFVKLNYVDDAARATLEKIIALKDRIAATDAQLHSIDRETSEIGQDQQRLRDNIKALTSTAEARQLITRYIAKAGDQETRLEQLTKDKQTAAGERTRLQEELETMIRSLTVDRLLTQRKAP